MVNTVVGIIMGSSCDWGVMKKAAHSLGMAAAMIPVPVWRLVVLHNLFWSCE
jgi:phosphoribosylcarboxyaminoimidazole (NCAIR) mutase